MIRRIYRRLLERLLARVYGRDVDRINANFPAGPNLIHCVGAFSWHRSPNGRYFGLGWRSDVFMEEFISASLDTGCDCGHSH